MQMFISGKLNELVTHLKLSPDVDDKLFDVMQEYTRLIFCIMTRTLLEDLDTKYIANRIKSRVVKLFDETKRKIDAKEKEKHKEEVVQHGKADPMVVTEEEKAEIEAKISRKFSLPEPEDLILPADKRPFGFKTTSLKPRGSVNELYAVPKKIDSIIVPKKIKAVNMLEELKKKMLVRTQGFLDLTKTQEIKRQDIQKHEQRSSFSKYKFASVDVASLERTHSAQQLVICINTPELNNE